MRLFSCRFPLPFSRGQKIKKNVGEGRLPATFNYTTRADKQWVDVSSGVARDLVPEIIDSGPMCIKDLFQNKSSLF